MHHQAITSLKVAIHCEHFSLGIFIKLVSPVCLIWVNLNGLESDDGEFNSDIYPLLLFILD